MNREANMTIKNKNIPIVFIHYGNSWYLEHTLRCAVATNPNANIYLVGDKINEGIANSTPGINFIHLDDTIPIDMEMRKWWDAFASDKYQHVGTATKLGTVEKHRFNILRWFRLYRIMNIINSPHVWYFDSDTLIARQLGDIEPRLCGQKYGQTLVKAYLTNWISGCASLWIWEGALREIMQTAYSIYTDNEFMERQRKIFESEATKGKGYNFCDMTILREWRTKDVRSLFSVGELTYPREYYAREWSMFDPNINLRTSDQVPSYFMTFETKGTGKDILWKDGIPYFKELHTGKLIRANTLNMSWCGDRRDLFESIAHSIIERADREK